MSSDNRFIVSGSEDNSIKVFDMQTKQQLHHFADAHQGTIILSFFTFFYPPLILFHRSSTVSCGVERQQVHRFGVLRQVDQGVRSADQAATAPLCRCTYQYHHSFFLSFLLSRHSSSFIVAVRSVAVSSDNRFIVSGSHDKSIKVFDLQTKQQLHHFVDAHQGTIILSFFTFFYPATHPLS